MTGFDGRITTNLNTINNIISRTQTLTNVNCSGTITCSTYTNGTSVSTFDGITGTFYPIYIGTSNLNYNCMQFLGPTQFNIIPWYKGSTATAGYCL